MLMCLTPFNCYLNKLELGTSTEGILDSTSLRASAQKCFSNFNSKKFFFTDPIRARKSENMMYYHLYSLVFGRITFTIWFLVGSPLQFGLWQDHFYSLVTEFGLFIAFAIMADFSTTCIGNSVMTGTISMVITLAFKITERVKVGQDSSGKQFLF